jgi:predicted RNA-binding Zn ribbon-like protein
MRSNLTCQHDYGGYTCVVLTAKPEAPHQFELTGGALCLDFANTIDNRLDRERRRDFLPTYADVIAWGRQAETITPAEAGLLLDIGRRQPRTASRALARAVSLREALYRVFSAVAAGRRPRAEDLVQISRVVGAAVRHRHLRASSDGFAWSWMEPARDAVDRVSWEVAQSAAELLVSTRVSSVRECAAENCGWLFLDTSRNQTRRWCDMRVCGNRVKVRRFFERVNRGTKS